MTLGQLYDHLYELEQAVIEAERRQHIYEDCDSPSTKMQWQDAEARVAMLREKEIE